MLLSKAKSIEKCHVSPDLKGALHAEPVILRVAQWLLLP